MNEPYQNLDPLQQERSIYGGFLQTHPKFDFIHKGRKIEYFYAGKGPSTLLVTPRISSLFPMEISYRTILDFEDSCKVLAPSLALLGDLDEIAESLLGVMDRESIGDAILLGEAGSGITAQAFFSRYPQRVRGMVLINPVVPDKSKGTAPTSLFFKLLPAFWMKSLLRKELTKPPDLSNVPEDQKPRLEFARRLLDEAYEARFSKRKFILELENALRFNAEGVIQAEALQGWKGRILIITSPDDAGYQDNLKLSQDLPNAELYLLEEGYGHLAPAVKTQEVQRKIIGFIASLG